MAISFDGPNKLISLSLGTSSLSLTDLWSRAMDWWLSSDNAKFLFPLRQVGGDIVDSGSGTSIPFYFYLVGGWRIKPQEANHTLNVVDGILLVDGGGDPFVNTLGTYTVRINFKQPVQAITVATGGSSISVTEIASAVRSELSTELSHILELQNGQGLSTAQATMLLEIYRLYGLDPTKPLVVTTTNRSAGAEILQTITGTDSITTITRV